MKYDSAYREEVTLKDGSTVLLRCVRPDDKEILQRGMARLSSQSRMRRFMYARAELSPAELAYLTEIDGLDHVAIGALRGDDTARPEGLAIARFIRLADPTVAEPALAVVDEMQGMGLGSALLVRLVAAALERGVTRFRGEVLAENRPMLALLHKLHVEVQDGDDTGNVVVIESSLADEASAADEPGSLRQILALAAKGAVRFRAPAALSVLRRPRHAIHKAMPAEDAAEEPGEKPGR